MRRLFLVLALAAAGAARADDLREITATAVPPDAAVLPADAMLSVRAQGPLGVMLHEAWVPATGPVALTVPVPPGVPVDLSLLLLAGGDADRQGWRSAPAHVAAGSDPVALGDLPLTPFEPLSFVRRFDCGGTAVTVGLAPGAPPEEIRLDLGGERLTLTATPAEEGARYGLPDDDTTWFWTRGQLVQLSRAGVETDCGPPPGVTYAAAGVGWTLALTGDPAGFFRGADFTLTLDGAETTGRLQPIAWVDGAAQLGPLDPGGVLVRVSPMLCESGMRDYPERVEVTMGDEVLVGCGGDPLPALAGAEWQVEDIGGGGIIDGAHVTLTFGDEGRAYGSGGCNRWSGSFTAGGATLAFDPAATTRMACAEALMTLEQAFLTALTQVTGYRIDDTGALVLTDAAGAAVLTARR